MSFAQNARLTFLASSQAVSFARLIRLVSATFLPAQWDDMMRADHCFAEWAAVYDGRDFSSYPMHAAPLPPRPYARDLDDEC